MFVGERLSQLTSCIKSKNTITRKFAQMSLLTNITHNGRISRGVLRSLNGLVT